MKVDASDVLYLNESNWRYVNCLVSGGKLPYWVSSDGTAFMSIKEAVKFQKRRDEYSKANNLSTYEVGQWMNDGN